MVAKFKNIKISGFGTGISLAANGSDVEFDNVEIRDCKIAIEQRDSPSLLQSIGLPNNLPPSVLLEALQILINYRDASLADKATLLSESNIGPYLQDAANVSAVVGTLVTLSASPMCAQLMSFLSSL